MKIATRSTQQRYKRFYWQSTSLPPVVQMSHPCWNDRIIWVQKLDDVVWSDASWDVRNSPFVFRVRFTCIVRLGRFPYNSNIYYACSNFVLFRTNSLKQVESKHVCIINAWGLHTEILAKQGLHASDQILEDAEDYDMQARLFSFKFDVYASLLDILNGSYLFFPLFFVHIFYVTPTTLFELCNKLRNLCQTLQSKMV